MDLELRPFSAINLADPFFDSLKAAYPEFSVWYAKKAAAGEKAYVFFFEDGRVADFLYMKIEGSVVILNHGWFLDEPSGRAERDRTHHRLTD